MCDQNGNWVRIQNRLRMNNLKFHGNKVPSASAAHGSVSDMIQSLIPEGVDPNFKLDRALSFTACMKKLEGLGLVQPPSSTKRSRTSDSVGELAQAHRENVCLFLKFKIF